MTGSVAVTVGATMSVLIVAVFELLPPGPLTVSVTVKAPVPLKVCEGLLMELVPPSPKAHDQLVAPMDMSVNHTCNGGLPDVFEALK